MIEYQDASQHVSNLSKDEIDSYASRVADSVSLPPGGDIVPIISLLGGRIHYLNGIESWSGDETIFVHGRQDFDIILSAFSSPRRDRFTIAHELGHYLLHAQQGDIPLVASRKGSNRAEWEANWFAGGLLMPQIEFRKAFGAGNSPLELAGMFAVSVPAVEVRSKVLGLSYGG